MKETRNAVQRSIGRLAPWLVLLATIMAVSASLTSPASAEGGDAEKLLKAMSDYVASQKTISVTYDSDIEVITSNLQKIQLTNSGQLPLSRQAKLQAPRTRRYRDLAIR